MAVQTVFKAGNSNVVAIPKDIFEEMQFKTGQKVTIEKSKQENTLIIRKIKKTNKIRAKPLSKEFKSWLNKVLDEDKEILDELAVR